MTERHRYLGLLDVQEAELRHSLRKDGQRGFRHRRLVEAELRQTGRSRLQVGHHASVRHFGLVQGEEAQLLQTWRRKRR